MALGTLKVTYSHSLKVPLYSPGQGCSCGPPLWNIIHHLIIIPSILFLLGRHSILFPDHYSEKLSDHPLLTTQDWQPRQYDCMLMDLALFHNFSPEVFQMINRHWIYSHALTIYNITTVDGYHILPEVLGGCLPECHKSTLQWIPQPSPSRSGWWVLWKIFLKYFSWQNKFIHPLIGIWFHRAGGQLD
jgi:hypothetical protein